MDERSFEEQWKLKEKKMLHIWTLEFKKRDCRVNNDKRVDFNNTQIILCLKWEDFFLNSCIDME